MIHSSKQTQHGFPKPPGKTRKHLESTCSALAKKKSLPKVKTLVENDTYLFNVLPFKPTKLKNHMTWTEITT